jgi:hypothetical protein
MAFSNKIHDWVCDYSYYDSSKALDFLGEGGMSVESLFIFQSALDERKYKIICSIVNTILEFGIPTALIQR